jgi:hypothetical protein
MSKIDEMRRRREAQFAQQQQQREAQKREKPAKRGTAAVERPSLVVVPPIVEVEVEPLPPANDAKKDKGKCSVCGKTKALQNGLLTSHQMGLGKMCAGTRKPPA